METFIMRAIQKHSNHPNAEVEKEKLMYVYGSDDEFDDMIAEIEKEFGVDINIGRDVDIGELAVEQFISLISNLIDEQKKSETPNQMKELDKMAAEIEAKIEEIKSREKKKKKNKTFNPLQKTIENVSFKFKNETFPSYYTESLLNAIVFFDNGERMYYIREDEINNELRKMIPWTDEQIFRMKKETKEKILNQLMRSFICFFEEKYSVALPKGVVMKKDRIANLLEAKSKEEKAQQIWEEEKLKQYIELHAEDVERRFKTLLHLEQETVSYHDELAKIYRCLDFSFQLKRRCKEAFIRSLEKKMADGNMCEEDAEEIRNRGYNLFHTMFNAFPLNSFLQHFHIWKTVLLADDFRLLVDKFLSGFGHTFLHLKRGLGKSRLEFAEREIRRYQQLKEEIEKGL